MASQGDCVQAKDRERLRAAVAHITRTGTGSADGDTFMPSNKVSLGLGGQRAGLKGKKGRRAFRRQGSREDYVEGSG